MELVEVLEGFLIESCRVTLNCVLKLVSKSHAGEKVVGQSAAAV
jgi:hypothetical protein